jgi:xanthine/uracil permease
VNPADERVPVRILLPLAVQHLLVMITGPISSVFLVSHALKLDADMSARLLAAFFLVSAIGTAFQSTGWLRVGARLPFVMLPGGAAVALFIQIAQQAGARTATGAVLLTAVCCFALVPVFLRIIRLFPPLVLGVMVVVIGVNLLRITAQLVLGSGGAAKPASLGLMAATIVATMLLARFLRGGWRRIAVLLGMVFGTVLGAVCPPSGSPPTRSTAATRPCGPTWRSVRSGMCWR